MPCQKTPRPCPGGHPRPPPRTGHPRGCPRTTGARPDAATRSHTHGDPLIARVGRAGLRVYFSRRPTLGAPRRGVSRLGDGSASLDDALTAAFGAHAAS